MSIFFKSVDGEKMSEYRYFQDVYDYAVIQKNGLILDGLSFWIIGIYTLKFSQFNDSLSSFFVTLKKSMLEIMFLLFALLSLMITLSLMFTYIYGPNINDYRSVAISLFTTLRIFLFLEYAAATTKFLEVDLYSSLVILFAAALGLRIFLFNLIQPIFIEYFRNENDQNFLTKKEGKFFEVPFLSKLKFLIKPFDEQKKSDSAFVPCDVGDVDDADGKAV